MEAHSTRLRDENAQLRTQCERLERRLREAENDLNRSRESSVSESSRLGERVAQLNSKCAQYKAELLQREENDSRELRDSRNRIRHLEAEVCWRMALKNSIVISRIRAHCFFLYFFLSILLSFILFSSHYICRFFLFFRSPLPRSFLFSRRLLLLSWILRIYRK